MNPFRVVSLIGWFGIGFASFVSGLCWIATGVLALQGKIHGSEIDAP